MMLLIGLKEKLLHLLKLIESIVSQTIWTVSFITVNACIAVLISVNNEFAFKAFNLGDFCNMCNHTLELVIVALSVFFNALSLGTHS